MISLMLCAACGKKPTQVPYDLEAPSPVPSFTEQIKTLCGLLPHDESLQEQESIKRFSYDSFTKKNVQLTSSLEFPIPIGFVLHSNQPAEHNACICYEGNVSVKKTIDFYTKQMKAQRWSYKDFSTTQEGLLVCTSKQNTVIVSLRKTDQQSSKKTKLFLFFNKNL